MRHVTVKCCFVALVCGVGCSASVGRHPSSPSSIASTAALCAQRRASFAAAHAAVAQLPARLATLRRLFKGEVEVDPASYQRLLRRNPVAGYNPRWNVKRARFSSLTVGPAGVLLELDTREVSDMVELMRRLDVFKSEPTWDLVKAQRAGKWVRAELRLRKGAAAKPPTAKPPVDGPCPEGVRAPQPTSVHTPGVTWKPTAPHDTGIWTRTGLEAQIPGGLDGLHKRYTKGPLPRGFTGVRIDARNGQTSLALHWHVPRRAAPLAPVTSAPSLLLSTDLPVRPRPPITMPFARRPATRGRPGSWDLSSVPWIKAARKQVLVTYLDLLEQTDQMLRQHHAAALAKAHKNALLELARCTQAMLAVVPNDEGEMPANPLQVSRLSFELRGDAARLQLALPGQAQVRKLEHVLNKAKVCKSIKGAKLQRAASKSAIDLTLDARLPHPKVDLSRYALGVHRLEIAKRGAPNKMQRRAFWDVVQQNSMLTSALFNRARNDQRKLNKLLRTGLAGRLLSIQSQSELAGATIQSLRSHYPAGAGTLRQRALDLETSSTLPQAMRLVVEILYMRSANLPSRWTWKDKTLKLRLHLLSLDDVAAER